MLNNFRAQISRVTAPLGTRLARAGVTPDAVTLAGTLGAVAGALVFFSQGWFFVGTLVVWFFVMLDMVDGAVARARGSSTAFGAVLDSTADRVADAAVFGALAWWFAGRGHSPSLLLASMLCLVLGALTSYVKARAEGIGLSCNVGFAERAERLIIALVGTGLDGLGVPYVQAVALWLLVGLSTLTVGQRLAVVWQQSGRRGPITAAAGQPAAPAAAAAPDSRPGTPAQPPTAAQPGTADAARLPGSAADGT
jgi:CDP-diacylglycerol---glycerol-3-phosphate 3-phosphatidyltransferase